MPRGSIISVTTDGVWLGGTGAVTGSAVGTSFITDGGRFGEGVTVCSCDITAEDVRMGVFVPRRCVGVDTRRACVVVRNVEEGRTLDGMLVGSKGDSVMSKIASAITSFFMVVVIIIEDVAVVIEVAVVVVVVVVVAVVAVAVAVVVVVLMIVNVVVVVAVVGVDVVTSASVRDLVVIKGSVVTAAGVVVSTTFGVKALVVPPTEGMVVVFGPDSDM